MRVVGRVNKGQLGTRGLAPFEVRTCLWEDVRMWI